MKSKPILKNDDTKTKRTVNSEKLVDQYVSQRIRYRRAVVGITLQTLADFIGVSSQQAHKYETGQSRIAVGKLYEIAKILNISVSWFFEEIEDVLEILPNSIIQKKTLELMKNFSLIENEKQQIAIGALARAMAAKELLEE